MSSDPLPPPQPDLGGLDPGELLARGMSAAHRTAGTPAWVAPAPEELARIMPQYLIERLLGHGGMGAVYLGEQVSLERKVAIKILPEEMAHDPRFFARFRREARTLARLRHPGIVAVYDFGQTAGGHPFFVMEYVEGTDLRQILDGPKLKPEQAFQLISEICDALHCAHRQGVIHRDIKPANVLIDREGRARLADFGLARPETEESDLTGTDQILGTPRYMAPEQHEGRADHRTDIFALGVMLYEMLTGATPRGVFEPPSRRVQVDVRIDEVVLKALQQEPSRRYQQASEMKTDVERISQAAPGRATTRRKLTRSALAALLVLPFVALGWLRLRPSAPPRVVPAPSTAAVTPATAPAGPFTNSLGMKFVPVTGTKVLFCTTLTRVQDFRAFVEATGYTGAERGPRVIDPGKIIGAGGNWSDPGFSQSEDCPVIDVNFDDAEAFCAWLSGKEHRHYRLPSDLEWSWAVGIGPEEEVDTLPLDKRTVGALEKVYPWGTAWPPPPMVGNLRDEYGPLPQSGDHLKGWKDGYLYTSPVGRFPPNRFGLYDMVGNAQQMTEDLYGLDTDIRRAVDHVMRGSSWNDGDAGRLRSAYRYPMDEYRKPWNAFRCVFDINPGPPPRTGHNLRMSPAHCARLTSALPA